jgi:hypothetical protein
MAAVLVASKPPLKTKSRLTGQISTDQQILHFLKIQHGLRSCCCPFLLQVTTIEQGAILLYFKNTIALPVLPLGESA